jgi:RNA polymerase sigma-70 factor, ECF subfamily
MPDSSRSPAAPVTDFLHAWSGGDREALDAIIPLVHAELKRLARRRLAGERPNHTIQPTALVNEAYLRLRNERGMQWQDRSHFLAVAAQLMRFILVDHARKRRNQKRGGDHEVVALDMDVADVGTEGVLRIDHALTDLAKVDERKARVVELRVFAGLSVDESARLLGVSPETIGRDWKFARAWLQRELTR